MREYELKPYGNRKKTGKGEGNLRQNKEVEPATIRQERVLKFFEKWDDSIGKKKAGSIIRGLLSHDKNFARWEAYKAIEQDRYCLSGFDFEIGERSELVGFSELVDISEEEIQSFVDKTHDEVSQISGPVAKQIKSYESEIQKEIQSDVQGPSRRAR